MGLALLCRFDHKVTSCVTLGKLTETLFSHMSKEDNQYTQHSDFEEETMHVNPLVQSVVHSKSSKTVSLYS